MEHHGRDPSRLPTPSTCTVIARTAELKNSPLFLFANHNGLSKVSILDNFWSDASGKVHALV